MVESKEELLELSSKLSKAKGHEALKILKLLERSTITADLLKDKVLPRRLVAVVEDYPEDKELSDATKSIKSLLKKRWNDIHKKSLQAPTTEEPVLFKIPFIKDGKASYTTMDD
jgi:hypothetical protein